MAEYKLLLPAMGEGVMEATVTEWVINIGDHIEEDDTVVEVATDKVDSEVPTPITGVLKEILVEVNQVVKVGEPLAIFEVEGEDKTEEIQPSTEINEVLSQNKTNIQEEVEQEQINEVLSELEKPLVENQSSASTYEGFISPLVKSICQKENISAAELALIQGTGAEGRITKEDLFLYLENRGSTDETISSLKENTKQKEVGITPSLLETKEEVHIARKGEEIIAMDRVRKLIAQNMLQSKQTAPHVTSFLEADVTKIVRWRDKHKDSFQKKEGEKLTYMPIFIEAIAKAIKDFPMINVSISGDNIIKKKDINIGMATALPSGNLIVPVIKNADQYSIKGLTKQINDLAHRARNNKLKPDEIQNGTYTVTNLGTFGNWMGTPIIPQPQVAIMALGTIVKKPAVISSEQGDFIGIRHRMFLSHAYDHRVVDGALGGMFLKKVADYLEDFDDEREP